MYVDEKGSDDDFDDAEDDFDDAEDDFDDAQDDMVMLKMMTKKRQGRARLAVDGTPITICTTTTVPSHLVTIIIIITINLFIIFHYHEDHITYSQPN